MIDLIVTPKEILGRVKKLPPRDQLRLVEQILSSLESQLSVVVKTTEPLQSLLGLWQGFSISNYDIAEARKEM